MFRILAETFEENNVSGTVGLRCPGQILSFITMVGIFLQDCDYDYD